MHKKESLRCLRVFARCAISEAIFGAVFRNSFLFGRKLVCFVPTDCLRNQECKKGKVPASLSVAQDENPLKNFLRKMRENYANLD